MQNFRRGPPRRHQEAPSAPGSLQQSNEAPRGRQSACAGLAGGPNQSKPKVSQRFFSVPSGSPICCESEAPRSPRRPN
eukprot:417638-Pyramimonas_sp.AAC.1